MIKLVLKLAVAAFVANAAVRLGSAYIVHVQFRDSVRQEVAGAASDDDRRQRVLDVAAAYDVPLEENDFSVESDPRHVFTEGQYVKTIVLMPGVTFPWTFNWEIDTYLAAGDSGS